MCIHPSTLYRVKNQMPKILMRLVKYLCNKSIFELGFFVKVSRAKKRSLHLNGNLNLSSYKLQFPKRDRKRKYEPFQIEIERLGNKYQIKYEENIQKAVQYVKACKSHYI